MEGGSSFWLSIVDGGNRIPPVDASDPEAECLWPSPETPRIEPSLDGDAERMVSGEDFV